MNKKIALLLTALPFSLASCGMNNPIDNGTSNNQTQNIENATSLEDLIDIAGYEISFLSRHEYASYSYVDGGFNESERYQEEIEYQFGQKSSIYWGYLSDGSTKKGYAFDSSTFTPYYYDNGEWSYFAPGNEEAIENYFSEAYNMLIPTDIDSMYLSNYGYNEERNIYIAGRSATKYSFTIDMYNDSNLSETVTYEMCIDDQLGIFLRFVKVETILSTLTMSYSTNTVSLDVTHFALFPTLPELPN